MKKRVFFILFSDILISLFVVVYLFVQTGQSAQNVVNANPSNYLSLLRNLKPGDTLILESGIYNDTNDVPGLPIFGLNGLPDKPIIITGPESGPRPVILGRSTHNTVRFDDASYIIVQNIEIDGRDLGGDAVNSQGISHHITLDNLYIHGVGSNRQIVGINTKAVVWNWNVRGNIIIGAGTGMYFGNSDGNLPFVGGLIEGNLIKDTIGYNIEIKHQNPRPDISGLPTGQSKTIIRHNVFSKANNAQGGGGARPNLLVGHFPLSGPGQDDVYEIYGNFFYHNPVGQPLFQGEGNVAIYNNLMVNTVGDAIWIQPHNDVPKMIRIFNNTILASDRAIKVTGGDADFQQKVIGNAVFAQTPIQSSEQRDNITDTFQAASNYLVTPNGSPESGTLDLFPKPGTLLSTLIDTSSINMFTDWNRDFNGTLHNGTFRGAYAQEGQNPGWIPKLEKKILSTLPVDTTAPTTPQSLNAVAANESKIDLTWQASTDPESGISKYNIYRNGVYIGQSTTTFFSDTGLTENSTYTYEVSAVNGRGLESTKSTPVSATTLADTAPPTIISVNASGDSTKVTVVFSKPVEQISAENALNYQIDPSTSSGQVTVSTASLGTDLKTVTLTTGPHTEGAPYTLTINRIKDRASTPNVIASNTAKTYVFVAQLVISNLTVAGGKAYEIVQDGLNNGAMVYIDRTYTYSSVPVLVVSATYIKTANNDKGSSDPSFITFGVNLNVTVFVAHDNRTTTKPSWMVSFTDTGDDIVTTDTALSLFAKDFPSGTVTLGGNEGGGNSMYTVIIIGQQGTNPDTIPPATPTGLRIE